MIIFCLLVQHMATSNNCHKLIREPHIIAYFITIVVVRLQFLGLSIKKCGGKDAVS